MQSDLNEWKSREYPIQEDMRFQAGEWRVRSFGWAALAFVLAAALLGLFSEGLFSTAVSSSPSGRLVVEHERFYRNGAPTSLTLRLTGEGGPGEASITLSPDLVRAFTLEMVWPEPVASYSDSSGLHLSFAGSKNLTARLGLRPDGLGWVSGRIGLKGADEVDFWQFIYP